MTGEEMRKELEPLLAKLTMIADEAEVDAQGILLEAANFTELLTLLEELRSLIYES